MIELLTRTLQHPAEWILLGLAALGALPAGALARRRLTWVPVVAVLVALGAITAIWREIDAASVPVISSLRGTMLSGHVATQHAAAASVLWWSSLLAASLCALAAWRAPGEPTSLAPSIAGVGIALLGAATGVYGAAVAGVVGSVASFARAAPSAAAVVLAAFAAGFAAESELHRALALTEPSQLELQIPLWWSRIALVGASLAWVGSALGAARRLGPGWLAAPLVAGAGILAAWTPPWQASRAWGPAHQLAGLAEGQGSAAPVHPPEQPWRWTGGCAWRPVQGGWRGHDWGTPSDRHQSAACAGAAPALPERPTLLLDADQRLDVLDALGAPGEVRVLVRLDEEAGPQAIEPWRWATEALAVVVPQGDPRASRRWPLRSDVVVVPGELPESLPERFGLDLVLVATPELTLADALRRCAEARRRVPLGLRCAVGVGDWGEPG